MMKMEDVLKCEEYFRKGMYDKCESLLKNITQQNIHYSNDVQVILENNMTVVQALKTLTSITTSVESLMEDFSNQLFTASLVRSRAPISLDTELILACNALWLGWHRADPLRHDAEAVHLCRSVAMQAMKQVLAACREGVADGRAEDDGALLGAVQASRALLPGLGPRAALLLAQLHALLALVLSEHRPSGPALLGALADLTRDPPPGDPALAQRPPVVPFRLGWGPVNATGEEPGPDLGPLAGALCLARLGDWGRASRLLAAAPLDLLRPVNNYIQALCQFNAGDLPSCQCTLKRILCRPAGTVVEFRARILQGRLLLKEGSAEAAIQEFSKALSLVEDSEVARYYMAQCHRALLESSRGCDSNRHRASYVRTLRRVLQVLQQAEDAPGNNPALLSWEQKLERIFHPRPEVTAAGVLYELGNCMARDQEMREASRLLQGAAERLEAGQPLQGSACDPGATRRGAVRDAAAAALWAGDTEAGRRLLASPPEEALGLALLADALEAMGSPEPHLAALDRSLKCLGRNNFGESSDEGNETTANALAAKLWLAKARNCLRRKHLKDMEHAVNMAQISNPDDQDVLFYRCVLLLSRGESSCSDLWLQQSRRLSSAGTDLSLSLRYLLRDRVSEQQKDWLSSTAETGHLDCDRSQCLNKLLE
ncbi:uncharacterized protein LOC134541896 isoform X2 [Bacillus rossius redtenbacheri]|uniref:uncharacterized protein LOC134541896 isoform X2 n=1 Tax=Bacillus rossius redtenbacheri TaxID=93214 RepID=UPI002FDC9CB5